MKKAESRRRFQECLLGNTAAPTSAEKGSAPLKSPTPLPKANEDTSAHDTQTMPTQTLVPVDGADAAAASGVLNPSGAPPADDVAGAGGGNAQGSHPKDSAADTSGGGPDGLTKTSESGVHDAAMDDAATDEAAAAAGRKGINPALLASVGATSAGDAGMPPRDASPANSVASIMSISGEARKSDVPPAIAPPRPL